KHFTPALMKEGRDHVIRIYSFSKAFAMTGWRVGFLHGSERNVSRILRYHDSLVTCAPVVSQYAAIAALRYAPEVVSDFKKLYLVRRNLSIAALDDLSHVLDYQTPRASYFVFPRIKDVVALSHDSRRLAYDILDRVGLALVPGVAFGPSGESHLRISFGRETKSLEEGLQRLREYFVGEQKRTRQPAKIQDLNTLKNSKNGLVKSIALSILKWAAKSFVQRNDCIVIGIAGTRGKTVLKRTVANLLSQKFSVRASILSYNTEIGLPLSILGIKSPQNDFDKILLPLRALSELMMPSSAPPKFLILEYGIRSIQDGKILKSICHPDILIVGSLSTFDPNMNLNEIQQGIVELAGSAKTLYLFSDDPLVAGLKLDHHTKSEIKLSNITETEVKSANSSYKHSRQLPGESYKLALLSAVNIAEQLGMDRKYIENFLEQDL
ncbi:MAG: aminotransferase class I/II-fold pyridoxal phosphate-dependent enzyme, partial [Bdellovibrionales bacterium]|nr:aminotransferase class I/II-fold pyridoxal phosphate-dependent enzyme [Bdellovibrionales bacterium]